MVEVIINVNSERTWWNAGVSSLYTIQNVEASW
jgi:hypothetical protein